MDGREEYMAQAHVEPQQTVPLQPIQAEGFILDIGGGGEGIIGRLHGARVVAIDKRISELEETRNEALKIVMDATDLKFLPATFAAATAFFTLMYIPDADLPGVLSEAHRVLKPGGILHIWDAVIPAEAGDKKYYVLPLRIVLPDETVETGYGVKLKEQTLQTIQALAHEAGFETTGQTLGDTTFHLMLEKK
ncbi:class I SAM-dependent methyltransferase [Candidatus Bathyarchaeota archaeon]|nr:class I SAM-dependent methyltransferase [Candidatus Bathyarchaeota archaeon]MBL7080710.1 class I SAM-dependent methyltransferase [Candidatus Bathyarchaeota archaeon]